MSYASVLTEVTDDFVGTITLNRAKALNTFTTQMATDLYQALSDLDADARVRVIVVKGSGKAFCAGIDVNELFGKSTLEYQRWIELMESPLGLIGRMKKPVIAQLHGVAAANGLGLVAACDLAVAADNARMGLTAINVGLNCVGPVVPIARLVGRKRALELLLYGELIPAARALEMGLINRICKADELDSEVHEWAAQLAKKSPVAVQIAKKSFYSAEDMDYHKAFEYMNEAFARLCSTEDAKEGVAAFLEKRQPNWKEK
ncbi:enoyl-CoA hydratase/isomerase family protein [Desulfatirhabdium butyrativorans]|uniref:enoyl-CoA hydratase/isomerase family protein n=1 Tax=Desulfatirhabdium butyrativorans TaxID=340467 RepID=UPI000424A151|nr:enoyl-CoA hydratase-related protein [Desulfatirhabdium butyrativorans]